MIVSYAYQVTKGGLYFRPERRELLTGGGVTNCCAAACSKPAGNDVSHPRASTAVYTREKEIRSSYVPCILEQIPKQFPRERGHNKMSCHCTLHSHSLDHHKYEHRTKKRKRDRPQQNRGQHCCRTAAVTGDHKGAHHIHKNLYVSVF